MRNPNRTLSSGPLSARRIARLVAGLVGVALVAACSTSDAQRTSTVFGRIVNSQRNPAIETAEQTVEYGIVPASRALVHAPDALLVFERNLGVALEQRIILPNATAVRGDNVMHLRAQTDASARMGEFNFDEIVARFGTLPPPFQRLQRGSLLIGEDAMGSYLMARENIGTDTICILVLRRLTGDVRPLPRGVRALDMVMRNCVTGSLEQALAPMQERSLAISGAVPRTVYTMSPFAAPQR